MLEAQQPGMNLTDFPLSSVDNANGTNEENWFVCLELLTNIFNIPDLNFIL